MHSEIEAKLKVDSLETVEQSLVRCGAKFLRETVQTDCYYDTVGRDLTRSDKALRLRSDPKGDLDRFILAYKGPKEQDDYKRRVELETEVSDAEATGLLLEELGYVKALAFNKRRRLWQMQDCEVALDELPLLGMFVEIEGPDSKTIAQVQSMLGLSGSSPIMASYACMVAERLSQLGNTTHEVYL